MTVEEKTCFMMQCVLEHLVYSLNQVLWLPNTFAHSPYPHSCQHKSLLTRKYCSAKSYSCSLLNSQDKNYARHLDSDAPSIKASGPCDCKSTRRWEKRENKTKQRQRQRIQFKTQTLKEPCVLFTSYSWHYLLEEHIDDCVRTSLSST